MTLGMLGEVTFSVSDSQLLTFQNLKMTRKARYAQHSVHGRKAVTEFTGFDAGSITFEMDLNAFTGVNPRQELDKLQELMDACRLCMLAIGGEIYGDRWLVSGLGVAFGYLYKDGTPTAYKVSVTLTEGSAANG